LPNGGYAQTDDGDDSFMGWRDAQFIISVLADWSRRFGFSWLLSVDSGEIGMVTPSGADDSVDELLSLLALQCGHPTDDPGAVESLAAELHKKYVSRL
jgi:hypothetical protein